MSVITDIEQASRNQSVSDTLGGIRNADRARYAAMKQFQSINIKQCPGCGQGLKFWWFANNTTLILCSGCAWTKQVSQPMAEARALGEEYIPGVTGVARGDKHAKITSDGNFIILTDK